VQFPTRQSRLQDAEVDTLIRVVQARQSFLVNGNGLTVAVLDTGLRTTHIDFAGRVRSQRNFTNDNQGDVNNANDGNGHGTNVGGIIVANGNHVGIAPGASIVPLKVLSNTGGGSFEQANQALQWVLDNHALFNINGAVVINDGDDEQDNVPNTGKNFLRLDAMAALDAVRRFLQINLLSTATAFRQV
jgi:subtilisin family serine protease